MENTIDQVEVFKSTLVNKSKDEIIQILMTLDPSVTTDSLKTSWGEVVSRYALIQRIVRALNLSEVKKEYEELKLRNPRAYSLCWYEARIAYLKEIGD